MPIGTEITFRLPNSPGALAEICRTLARERVGILALMLEAGGRLRLVVDNVVRAGGVLRESRHQIETREVLVVRTANTAGALAPLLALVADAGVNVEYAYAAAGEGSVTATVVLGLDDAPRAATAAGL
jgi:hypothetical protein